MTDDGWSPGRGRVLPAALFTAIAVLVGVDLAHDYASGTGGLHAAFEGAVLLLALAGVATLWRQVVTARRRALALRSDLVTARADAARWRAEAEELLRGLGAAIDRQFERWGLTPAEREVALLLLKGLAMTEIAAVRSTSERTVRQQALAVYRKAGVGGRAELAAFFLEDLFLPE